MSIRSKIQSLITAANGVTGDNETDLTSAVQNLVDGYGQGGGGGSVETGTFTVASDITVSVAGIVLPVGFSGSPDSVRVWLDKDDFDEISNPGNTYWYAFAVGKYDSTLPTVRISGTQTLQDLAALNVNGIYYSVKPNVSTVESGTAPNGKGLGSGGFYTSNVQNFSINNDGTLTIARYSSATSVIPTGTYHYVAITGAKPFLG